MTAPELGVVAWRTSGRSWSTWHLCYVATPDRTLCLRRVGLDATRERHGTDPTCAGCLAVLDMETRNRLELTNG